MEHKKRKMFAALAVMMLCAVAIVGVGYAYTAQTNNEGNNVHSEYVKLSQSGTGAYTFSANTEVYYDTVNYTDAEHFRYTLSAEGQELYPDASASRGAIFADHTLVQIGQPINVDASSVGRQTSNLVCTFKTTGFDLNAGWLFIVKIVDNAASPATTFYKLTNDDMWTPQPSGSEVDSPEFTIYNVDSTTKGVTVTVYYGYADASLPITDSPLAVPLNNAKIEFKATDTGDNTALVLDETLTVTIGTPSEALVPKAIGGSISGDVTWTTLDADVATVAGGVVTGVSAGTTGIMASATIGGQTYTAICTVTVQAAP